MSKIRFKPLSDKVIFVEAESKETWGDTCIIIPDASKQKPTWGEAIAVGEGSCRQGANAHEMKELAPGKTYVFEKYCGLHFRILGQEYLSIRKQDIHAELEQS